jgi:hypothetical protein
MVLSNIVLGMLYITDCILMKKRPAVGKFYLLDSDI